MLCIAYVLSFAMLLSLAGALLDYGLPTVVPRRFLWLAIILISAIVPPVFAFYNASRGLDVWGMHLMTFSGGSGMHHGTVGPTWLARCLPWVIPVAFGFSVAL